MGTGQSLVRTFSKVVPASRGYIQPAVTGIGFDAFLKFVDGFFGSPAQSFGMTLPIVGRISAIDIINYVVHAHGFHLRKEGIMALVGAKGIQTGFNLRPRLAGISANVTTALPSTSAGANL